MRSALLALALAPLGCVQPLAPDVGPLTHAPCSDADSDPSTDVSFARDLQPLILDEYHCVRCHAPDGPTPLGYELTGLDLSTYTTLRAGARIGAVVTPGQPCASVLVQKLGEAPPFGARMPLDGPPFLEGEDVRAFADWIAEGARDD